MSGIFISLEGIDGAGKSTQACRLVEMLQSAGHDVVTVREPGTTPLAERVRPVILDREMTGIGARAELLLYLACRAQLEDEIVRPALEAGKTVVSDRYADSSVAYQGYGRELGADLVRQVNAFATGGLMPDLTIVIDIPVELTAQRRTGSADRLEAEDRAFHQRIRAGFIEIAEGEPERCAVVDGTASEDDVASAVAASVRRGFPGLLGD